MLGPEIIEGARRFTWNQRFIQIPYNAPIVTDIIYALANDGFNNGFPIGIIADESTRIEQIEGLGTIVEGELSKIIQLGKNELRVYDRFRNLLEYVPGTPLPQLH